MRAPDMRLLERGHVITPTARRAPPKRERDQRRRDWWVLWPRHGMGKGIDSRSKAGCLSRNSAVDDSIGESYGVTDFSVQ